MAAWRASVSDDRIELSGELRAEDARSLWETVRAFARSANERLDVDLSNVTAIDARPLALLVELRASLVARGVQSELIAPEALRPQVQLFTGRRTVAAPPVTRRAEPLLGRLGAAVERMVERAKEPLSFLGELVDGVAQVVRKPERGNWRSLPGLLERAGADAISIVILLNFLVGFVIALQAAPQLKELGANPFVADLVSVSVTRELAPLMTAIIMSGRSGAAFAAELGTMHVTDEIDALETMGISPIPYLVIPRILALALVAPALVMLADVAAVLGGLVVGVFSLDLTVQGYFTQIRVTLAASDIWSGLIKGSTFAVAIAIIGCQEGLAARGAAAGVGRRTTATVVVSLFTVVVLDSILTIFFRAVHI
jgi:phospholipid/cholesterol/gamma-HCH transport system permease protein